NLDQLDDNLPVLDDETSEAAEAKPEMPAREALEKLRRGEPIRNVRIQRLCFQGEFPKPVEMKGVVLVQPRFERATFQGSVSLVHCTLDRPKFAKATAFEAGLNLTGSLLLKPAFHSVTVRGPLRCDNTLTRGLCKICNTRFEGPVRFWEARFRGWVDFVECEFLGQGDFRSLHAEEGFTLTRCRFADEFLFRGATVAKKWDATTSRFEGLID